MSKIGFHFVTNLPSDVDVSEEKSFYYVKKEIQRQGINGTVIDTFAEIYLGVKNNQNVSEFYNITAPVNFYAREINGINLLSNYETHPNMGVNLTLNDICSYQPNNNVTSTSIVVNDDVVVGKYNGSLIFSNVKNKPINFGLQNYISGLNIGNENSTYNEIRKTLFIGNNINFWNTDYDDTIVIGNNIDLTSETVDNNKKITNNLFIGGKYYEKTLNEYIVNHEIKDNIFIKNLGYGNLSTNFHFSLPLRLSSNTELATIDDGTINNYQRLAVVKDDGTIGMVQKSEYIQTPTLEEVVTEGNNTGNPIMIVGAFIGSNKNYSKRSIFFGEGLGSAEYGSYEYETRIGSNVGSGSYSVFLGTLAGGHNIGYDYSVLIGANASYKSYGINNVVNGFEANLGISIGGLGINPVYNNNNVIIGYKSGVNTNTTTQPYYNYSILLGSEAGYRGDYNIIIGSNTKVDDIKLTKNNAIAIGSFSTNAFNSNTNFIIHNYANKTESLNKIPLISGSFENKTLNLSGKVSLDLNEIQNSTENIEFNKTLTLSTTGEIGYEPKPTVANNSYSTTETKTGGTWIDGKPIYRKVLASFGNPVSDTNVFDLLGMNIDYILPTISAQISLLGSSAAQLNSRTTFYSNDFNTLEYYRNKAIDSSFDNFAHKLTLDYGDNTSYIIVLVLEYTKTTD